MVGVAALPRVIVIIGEGFAFWFVEFVWLVTVKTFLVPDPEVMLMMTAEDVVLPGVFVKELEADIGEVELDGLLVTEPVETKLCVQTQWVWAKLKPY